MKPIVAPIGSLIKLTDDAPQTWKTIYGNRKFYLRGFNVTDSELYAFVKAGGSYSPTNKIEVKYLELA